jgi:hypothetical protein
MEVCDPASGHCAWEVYRSANRTGRGQPLSAKGRKQVWQIFERVLSQLQAQNKTDWSGLYRHAGALIHIRTSCKPL